MKRMDHNSENKIDRLWYSYFWNTSLGFDWEFSIGIAMNIIDKGEYRYSPSGTARKGE